MREENKRDYKITSFSRLNAYQTCSQFYKRKYIDKVRPKEPLSEHLVRGVFVHSVLEEYLDPNTKTDTIEDSLYIHFGPWLKMLGVGIDIEEAWEFANDFSELITRASHFCNDPDLKIRTKSGEVPKDLQNYPPNSWKSALKKSGLTEKRYELDNKASRNSEDFIKLSFSYFVGEIFHMLKNFAIPDWVDHTVCVERGFSSDGSNKLKMPGSDDLFFNGFIDWVVRDKENNIVILDHKTSKKEPTELSVQHLPQLNLYVWGYYIVYGEWPSKIGIYHARSGKYIISEVDRSVVKETVVYYSHIQKSGVDSQSFVKRHPEDYSSPCIRRSWKTDEVTHTCPYLQECWPSYYQCISTP